MDVRQGLLAHDGRDDNACRILCAAAAQLNAPRPKPCPELIPLAHWFRVPAARWTGAHGGQAFFAYSTNENAIIVDVEATTAIRQAEVLAAKRMIERSLGTVRSLSEPAPR